MPNRSVETTRIIDIAFTFFDFIVFTLSLLFFTDAFLRHDFRDFPCSRIHVSYWHGLSYH